MAYLYGGDYNPEQWPAQVRAEDPALMRQAGVNLATVGVFSWSALEPAPGRFEFGWLDRVLDDLHAYGIGVALATPTASPPPWFTLRHPDALAQTRDGVRLVHGSRDTYCVNAPAYRDACRTIASALADRYAGHPALRLWHVHNEYGTWCFCAYCAAAFRRWLQHRHGDLTGLNQAWSTAFWGQGYGDWAEILPPRATQYLHNPAQELDYRRFLSDSMLAAYAEQRDLIKAVAPDAVVSTNFVLGGWVPVDHARWAGEVDLVAIDHYPSTLHDAAAQSAFAADAARGWSRAAGHGGEWLLMEHAPATVTENGVTRAKPPGMMARLALGHLARGSRGALFFQWRAGAGGAEQWHSAVIPHAGPDSRVFREAAALGALLPTLPPPLPPPPPASGGAPSATDSDRKVPLLTEVAVWYDEQCGWALPGAHLPAQVDYEATVRRFHEVLWRHSHPVDVVPAGADLSGYRLVVVPAAYLLTAAHARSLADHVTRGGHLVVTYLTGLVDADARVHLGGYPGPLRELLGVRIDEFDPLPAGVEITLDTGDTATGWTERCHAVDAVVEAFYPADRAAITAGGAAITRRDIGAGTARYLSCALTEPSLERWLLAVCAAAGVEPVLAGLPGGVEAVRSRGALWLFNHADQPRTAAGVDLAAGAVQVLPG